MIDALNESLILKNELIKDIAIATRVAYHADEKQFKKYLGSL